MSLQSYDTWKLADPWEGRKYEVCPECGTEHVDDSTFRTCPNPKCAAVTCEACHEEEGCVDCGWAL